MAKNKFLTVMAAAAVSCTAMLSSCEDDISQIGPSLVKGEVVINIDSVGFKLNGHSVETPVIDSRDTTNLLGRLSVPEYGDLRCSFVSRMMCATALGIPDSIKTDSVSAFVMKLNIPRGRCVGDTLAPQKLKVYELTKQLPSDITSAFNPEGYYEPSSLMGSSTYTLSHVAGSDSAYMKQKMITIAIPLNKKKGREIFNTYRNNPEVFSWPQTFAEYFPGIYVENSFGRGAVANISNVVFNLYYRHAITAKVYEDSVYVDKRIIKTDSVSIFSTAPEVLSSNNISFTPSKSVTEAVGRGEVLLVAPAGYNVDITFPTQEIVDQYWKSSGNISVVNNLTLTLPASEVDNDYDIGVPPNLLLVKTKDLAEFFSKNKVPDNVSSFVAAYSETDKSYTFSSMRSYLMPLIESGEPVSAEDMEFTIVPVAITREKSSNSSASSVIVSCVPYIARPTMCRFNLDNAKIKFTYSQQQID